MLTEPPHASPTSGPPVVLVHGWGGSFATTWERSGFTALLADANRVAIGVDLLGHGAAPKPHEPEAYDDLTRRVVEALPTDGPVDAVGFSLGAMTLLRTAVDDPSRFRRLVLAGIGRNVFESDEESTRRIVEAIENGGDSDDNRARLFAQYASQPGNDRAALAAIMARTPAAPLTDEEIGRVTCPVLVAVGDNDFVLPADRLVEALPQATFKLLRRTDHFATPESFDFIDAALEFLDAIPADLLTTDVEEAADRLRRGGLVAIPTETVYGLAADARQPAAVARIFEVKGRPRNHPLIVHVAGVNAIDGWIGDVSDVIARHVGQLADACWPGPLTMLVPRGPHVLDTVNGGLPAVGLRVPAHPMTLALIGALGTGLAAPSANRFGRVSPTTARHVVDDLVDFLDPATDAVLDGGSCPVGVESTIVDLTTSPPQVLRAGAIEAADIESILAGPVADAVGPSRASGMLAAHYAPACEVVLVDDADQRDRELGRRRARGERVAALDRTDDLVVAARELYADLRHADDERLDALVVVLPPASGLGHALRDRLLKAAAGSRRSPPSPTR